MLCTLEREREDADAEGGNMPWAMGAVSKLSSTYNDKSYSEGFLCRMEQEEYSDGFGDKGMGVQGSGEEAGSN